METIKFVAFDIDGTLVDGQKRLGKSFDSTMQYLLSHDIQVCISSGRQIYALLRDFDRYKNDFYFLADNGCIGYYQGKVLFSNTLPFESMLKITDQLYSLDDVYGVVSGVKKAYIKKDSPQFLYDRIHPYYVYDSIMDFKDIDDQVLKIAGYVQHDSQHRIEEKCQNLKSLCDVVVSGDEWCDFNPKNVNKGIGIQRLLELLNIHRNNAAAIGDQDNDLQMLQAVSHSIAMINGSDNIKKVARYITDLDNNHDGACQFVLKLVQEME